MASLTSDLLRFELEEYVYKIEIDKYRNRYQCQWYVTLITEKNYINNRKHSKNIYIANLNIIVTKNKIQVIEIR